MSNRNELSWREKVTTDETAESAQSTDDLSSEKVKTETKHCRKWFAVRKILEEATTEVQYGAPQGLTKQLNQWCDVKLLRRRAKAYIVVAVRNIEFEKNEPHHQQQEKRRPHHLRRPPATTPVNKKNSKKRGRREEQVPPCFIKSLELNLHDVF